MAANPSPLSQAFVAGERLGSFELERVLVASDVVQWINAHAVADPEKAVLIRRRREHSAETQSLVQSFLSRAQAATTLKHPGLVPVLEAHGDGLIAYAAVERIDGCSLADLLRAWSALDKPMPVPIACGIVCELLDALAAIHNKKLSDGRPLVHGGIEPRRVRMTEHGEIKLGGLARELDDSSWTGHYHSPEYLRRESLEPRSDIFSVGLLLYQLLTSTLPFSTLAPKEARAGILYESIPSPRQHVPDLPEDLATLVSEAVSRERSRRPASAGDMAARLRAMVPAAQIAAPPRAVWLASFWKDVLASMTDTAPPPPAPAAEPKSTVKWIAVLAVLVGIGGAGVTLTQLYLTTHTANPQLDMTGGMKPIPGVLAPHLDDGGTLAGEAADAGVKKTAGTPARTAHSPLSSGTLTLVTHPPVQVFYNRRLLGETPLMGITLPAGHQRLQLRLPDGKQQVYPVVIHAGKSTSLRIDLR